MNRGLFDSITGNSTEAFVDLALTTNFSRLSVSAPTWQAIKLGGVVYLQGQIKRNSGSWTASEIVGYLPGGMRPVNGGIVVSAPTSTANQFQTLTLSADGQIIVSLVGTAAPTWVSLGGLSFVSGN